MSEPNVETVERAIAALNARDIEGYLGCCTTQDRSLHQSPTEQGALRVLRWVSAGLPSCRGGGA